MPSQKILAQKQAIVAELAERLGKAQAGVLVQYQGITVDDDTKLRAELRKAGVNYTVMKNTMTGRACEEAGLGEMKQYLEGMTAIATSDTDPIVSAKILSEYASKIESFEIRAGFIDGGVIDAAKVEELAKTPSREVLIGKMLGSMTSSLYAFARVLQAKMDKDAEGADAPVAEATEEVATAEVATEAVEAPVAEETTEA